MLGFRDRPQTGVVADDQALDLRLRALGSRREWPPSPSLRRSNRRCARSAAACAPAQSFFVENPHRSSGCIYGYALNRGRSQQKNQQSNPSDRLLHTAHSKERSRLQPWPDTTRSIPCFYCSEANPARSSLTCLLGTLARARCSMMRGGCPCPCLHGSNDMARNLVLRRSQPAPARSSRSSPPWHAGWYPRY